MYYFIIFLPFLFIQFITVSVLDLHLNLNDDSKSLVTRPRPIRGSQPQYRLNLESLFRFLVFWHVWIVLTSVSNLHLSGNSIH